MRRKLPDPVVLGLDLSLKHPAGVIIPAKWRLGDWKGVALWSVETADPTSDRDRYLRLVQIVDMLIAFSRRLPVTHAYVEDYAFSKHSSSVTRLAELGGHARARFLTERGLVLRPVTASQARRQLLGALPAKDSKIVAQRALYAAPGCPFANGDECDAFMVANWGLTECGLVALSLA